MLITLLLSFKPLAFIKLVNLMEDVSNAALTPPLGCLHLWFVAIGALQGALPLFTATLHVQTSRCACKQRLHANITVPLLIRADCNYIMSQALTSRECCFSVTTPLALGVSWLRCGPHNLIHSFCHAAKRHVAPAKLYRP